MIGTLRELWGHLRRSHHKATTCETPCGFSVDEEGRLVDISPYKGGMNDPDPMNF